MRWFVFLIIQSLIILVIIAGFYIHQEHVIVLKQPPESIAQWYKPQNKRQVWLHTMFRLRREILAIEIYAKTKDDKNLQKWTEKLNEDYHKIAEMVPEWQKRLDLAVITDIQKSVYEKRYNDVTHALVELDKSCQSCHTDFRAVTATIYRVPDFSDMKIDGSTSLISHMRTMSKQVNQIKIAFVDGRQDAALSAFLDLEKAMNSLGDICENCHKKSSKSYPNEKMTHTMADLEQSLKTGSLEDQGKALGTVAVMVCAECHGTHRLAHDAKTLLNKKKNWGELLKHSF
jgi:cytochrome c556